MAQPLASVGGLVKNVYYWGSALIDTGVYIGVNELGHVIYSKYPKERMYDTIAYLTANLASRGYLSAYPNSMWTDSNMLKQSLYAVNGALLGVVFEMIMSNKSIVKSLIDNGIRNGAALAGNSILDRWIVPEYLN